MALRILGEFFSLRFGCAHLGSEPTRNPRHLAPNTSFRWDHCTWIVFARVERLVRNT